MRALDIAKYFLYLNKINDNRYEISNLKIQKMLYYAQGECLSLFGKQLFKDDIEAWKHGAVVPRVYKVFKHYGRENIDFNELEKFNPNLIEDEKIKDFLSYIYNKYAKKRASALEEMNHNEPTWQNAIKKKTTNNNENIKAIITKKAIKKYFKQEREKKINRLKDIADEYSRTIDWK